MLSALLLDWLGQLLIFVWILAMPAWIRRRPKWRQSSVAGAGWCSCCCSIPFWVGYSAATPFFVGGDSLPVLLQRLIITGVATLMVVAIARWLINPSDLVWLVCRRVQFLWIGALSLWVLAVRVGLRRGLLLPDAPQILLLVQPGSWIRFWRSGVAFPSASAVPGGVSSNRPKTRSGRGANPFSSQPECKKGLCSWAFLLPALECVIRGSFLDFGAELVRAAAGAVASGLNGRHSACLRRYPWAATFSTARFIHGRFTGGADHCLG